MAAPFGWNRTLRQVKDTLRRLGVGCTEAPGPLWIPFAVFVRRLPDGRVVRALHPANWDMPVAPDLLIDILKKLEIDRADYSQQCDEDEFG